MMKYVTAFAVIIAVVAVWSERFHLSEVSRLKEINESLGKRIECKQELSEWLAEDNLQKEKKLKECLESGHQYNH